MKKCTPHGAHVPDEQAVLIDGDARTSGPDVPVYACRDCAERLGLTVLDDRPAKRCSRCGRLASDHVAQSVDDDRGPLEVIWCRDAAACEEARQAARLQMPRRAMHP